MSLVVRVKDGDKAKALARRIKEKAPLLTCAACGFRDFGLIEQPDIGLRTWLVRTGSPDEQQKTTSLAQPMISLICTRCGFLNEFSEATLSGADPAAYGIDVD